MKIVHCIFSFTVGGAETMLVDILDRQSLNHDVSLVVVNDIYDENLLATVSDRVRIIKLDRRSGSFPLVGMIRLNWLLRKMAPDIIHVHDNKLLGLIRGLDEKIWFTVHDVGLAANYVRRGHHLIAISKAVMDDIIARGITSGNMLRLINNGIRADEIVYRKAMPLSNEIKIVNVGRLNHNKKGQHILIEAVAELRRKGYNVTADFIGEGDSFQFLQELSCKLGVEDSINFLGNKSRDFIYAHLADYDLMCHSSIFEGFGLTVAEGMAAGLSVVVSTGDGPFEIIAQGKYGAYFENGNPQDCACVLRWVIDNYPQALERARLARQHVLEHYSIDSMVKEYIRYYNEQRYCR